MENRKKQEIEYFDKGVEQGAGKGKKAFFESLNPTFTRAYKFLYKFLKDKCPNKRILDYGCGDGFHSVWLARQAGRVVGIDLSEPSLESARAKVQKEEAGDRADFLLMDCENLKFENNYFDIVFDAGTFPSLDLDKALPEISRVLKPEGFLIGVETLGHNPFGNLKRKLFKQRTGWAREHILKINDFEKMKKYFQKIDIHFFHLISCLVFPLVNLPGARILLKLLETIDSILLFLFPFLKKYCFKVVFIARK